MEGEDVQQQSAFRVDEEREVEILRRTPGLDLQPLSFRAHQERSLPPRHDRSADAFLPNLGCFTNLSRIKSESCHGFGFLVIEFVRPSSSHEQRQNFLACCYWHLSACFPTSIISIIISIIIIITSSTI